LQTSEQRRSWCAALVSTVVGIRRPLVSELHARPLASHMAYPNCCKGQWDQRWAGVVPSGGDMSSGFLRGYREHSPLGAGRPTVQPLATTASCATRRGGGGESRERACQCERERCFVRARQLIQRNTRGNWSQLRVSNETASAERVVGLYSGDPTNNVGRCGHLNWVCEGGRMQRSVSTVVGI